MFPISFLLPPFVGRVALAVVLIAAIVGGIYLKGRKDGSTGAISSINDQTQDAIEAAENAARSVDDCYRRDGMRWNVSRARCERDHGDSWR